MAKLPPLIKKAKKGPIIVRAAPVKKIAKATVKAAVQTKPPKPSLKATRKVVTPAAQSLSRTSSSKKPFKKEVPERLPPPPAPEKKGRENVVERTAPTKRPVKIPAKSIPEKAPEKSFGKIPEKKIVEKRPLPPASLLMPAKNVVKNAPSAKADTKRRTQDDARQEDEKPERKNVSPPSVKGEGRAKKLPEPSVPPAQEPPVVTSAPIPSAPEHPLALSVLPAPKAPTPSADPPAEPARRRPRVREILADDEKLRRHIEALLFSSGKAMLLDQLAQLVGCEPAVAKKYLESLQQEYETRGTALKVFEENGTWRMLIKDEHVDVVRKVVAETELSRAALETLAVIAYKHPKALQSIVVNIRGGNAYDHIRELEEKGFVAKHPEGRSFLLKLTDKFFEYFDVESPEDIKKVFDAVKPKELQQKLGELDVVDVLPETKQHDAAERRKKTVDGLEVVDVPAPDEHEDETGENDPNNPFLARKLGNRPEVSEEERSSHVDFLKGLDDQIDALSKRNAEYDQDETFKRAAGSQETASGDGARDGGDAPADEGSSEDSATGGVDEDADENSGEDAEGKPKKSALDEPLDLTKL